MSYFSSPAWARGLETVVITLSCSIYFDLARKFGPRRFGGVLGFFKFSQ